MTNMTLAVPDDLHALMKKHKTTKWSEVARQALWEEARKLELMETLLEDSELSEKDSEEIGKLVKNGITQHHKWTSSSTRTRS